MVIAYMSPTMEKNAIMVLSRVAMRTVGLWMVCNKIILRISDCIPETVLPKYCGDGKYAPYLGEECDDGNNFNMDGCSKSCKIEDNFDCVVLPIGSTSKCTSNVKDNCGNGILEERKPRRKVR